MSLSGVVNFKAIIAVRQDSPFWTNRKLINGVIDAAESLIGDAPLEDIISGAMDDIKVWAEANDLQDLDNWTTFNTIPIAIMRATTYAVVAALYSRKTQTFQGKVIPSVAPVTIHVASEQEKALKYWEGKYADMLSMYLSIIGGLRIAVSTADEEPIFSSAEIVPPPASDVEWYDWLVMNGMARLVGSGGTA